MEQHGFESRTCGCFFPVLIVNWMLQQIEFKFELSLSLIFGDFIKHLEHGHIKNGYQTQATHTWKADLTNIVDVVLNLPRTKTAEPLWIPLKKVTDKIQKQVRTHQVCCKLERVLCIINPPPPPNVLGEFPCESYNNKNCQSVDKMAWLLPHELTAGLSYTDLP